MYEFGGGHSSAYNRASGRGEVDPKGRHCLRGGGRQLVMAEPVCQA